MSQNIKMCINFKKKSVPVLIYKLKYRHMYKLKKIGNFFFGNKKK